jgi:hypothetical protein
MRAVRLACSKRYGPSSRQSWLEETMLRGAFLILLLAVTTVTGVARTANQPTTDCRDRLYSGGRERAVHCENREETFAGSGLLDVDASRNGGIRVRGWDRTDIRVVAQITAWADSESRARALAEAVRIETGGRIRASGPDTGRGESWHVGYQIDVPRDARLALNTLNGGITIEDFRGSATFRATNGGVSLTDVSGDIRGATTNGALNIRLTGDRWEGAGLEDAGPGSLFGGARNRDRQWPRQHRFPGADYGIGWPQYQDHSRLRRRPRPGDDTERRDPHRTPLSALQPSSSRL